MRGSLSGLGMRIRELREKSGISQKQLAAYLEADQSLVSKIEKGERAVSSDMLERIAMLFCVPVSLLSSDEASGSGCSVAFRTDSLSSEDLFALSVVNRIVLNQLEMDSLEGDEADD